MTRQPHLISETWRGAARALPIKHGLDRILDLLEERLDTPAEPGAEVLDELLPLSTGLVALDQVLAVVSVEARAEQQLAPPGGRPLRLSRDEVKHLCVHSERTSSSTPCDGHRSE
ncbi:hypothetical protein [Rhabdothermincola salaria]|uniref:hypothetical protein n=1 Tax=Rhabdothermincola salaria TaxID=2903142 RepID=UPI001E40DE05|nr:hypothetical protein [Rhabdothermincola salaria]MCD9625256.1 hypothetical protein [Rhabdothermincola salaria]